MELLSTRLPWHGCEDREEIASIVERSDPFDLAMHLPSFFGELVEMGRIARKSGCRPEYSLLKKRLQETMQQCEAEVRFRPLLDPTARARNPNLNPDWRRDQSSPGPYSTGITELRVAP